MGHLYGVMVDIEGACALADFEVIEIVDDSNPYLALPGIEWDFDMHAVIKLKKMKMTFEKNALRVVVPLHPAKCYTKKCHHDYLQLVWLKSTVMLPS